LTTCFLNLGQNPNKTPVKWDFGRDRDLMIKSSLPDMLFPSAGIKADPWCSVSFHNSNNSNDFLLFSLFNFKSYEVRGKMMLKTLYNVFDHMLKIWLYQK
jgi:hypothetical protein